MFQNYTNPGSIASRTSSLWLGPSDAFSTDCVLAHVEQADAGAKSTGPLLARPAGADAFLLANVFPITPSPVGLSNREGSFTPGFYAGTSSEYDVRALRRRD